MADVEQFDSSSDQPQGQGTLCRIASDSYTSLLAVGVLLLLISLALLGILAWERYGLLSAKPISGSVVSVSKQRISVDMGAEQGLEVGKRLLVLRRGAFVADLKVRSVSSDKASAEQLNALGEALDPDQEVSPVRGDRVVFAPGQD